MAAASGHKDAQDALSEGLPCATGNAACNKSSKFLKHVTVCACVESGERRERWERRERESRVRAVRTLKVQCASQQRIKVKSGIKAQCKEQFLKPMQVAAPPTSPTPSPIHCNPPFRHDASPVLFRADVRGARLCGLRRVGCRFRILMTTT